MLERAFFSHVYIVLHLLLFINCYKIFKKPLLFLDYATASGGSLSTLWSWKSRSWVGFYLKYVINYGMFIAGMLLFISYFDQNYQFSCPSKGILLSFANAPFIRITFTNFEMIDS